MTRHWMAPLGAGVMAMVLASAALPAAAKSLPAEWDGLVKVDAKTLEAVYLLPGADFRPYTKVMLDPAQVAFRKNWMRDYNDQSMALSHRISQSDADRMAKMAREGFDEILAKAYADAGYQVVTAPGPDVMRLSPAVINLVVTAPDIMTPDMSMSWAVDAGEATVVLEARDSATGAILGRAADRREAGENAGGMPRSSVTNRSDFAVLFKRWARTSADGLAKLKGLSPINESGQTAAR